MAGRREPPDRPCPREADGGRSGHASSAGLAGSGRRGARETRTPPPRAPDRSNPPAERRWRPGPLAGLAWLGCGALSALRGFGGELAPGAAPRNPQGTAGRPREGAGGPGGSVGSCVGGRTGATRSEKVPWASEEEVSCLHPWLPPPAAVLQDPGPSVSTGRPSRTRDSAAEPRECRYLAALPPAASPWFCGCFATASAFK